MFTLKKRHVMHELLSSLCCYWAQFNCKEPATQLSITYLLLLASHLNFDKVLIMLKCFLYIYIYMLKYSIIKFCFILKCQ